MISMEKYYEYRKQLQQLYDNSVNGIVKGMIYNELAELKIDYDFIDNTSINIEKKTVTFEIISIENQKYIDNILIPRINQTIKDFVIKNVKEVNNDELINFLDQNDYYFDIYRIYKDDKCIITVQL